MFNQHKTKNPRINEAISLQAGHVSDSLGVFIVAKQRIKNTFIRLPKLSKLGDINISPPLTETSFSVVNISLLSLTVVTIFNSNACNCKCSLTT